MDSEVYQSRKEQIRAAVDKLCYRLANDAVNPNIPTIADRVRERVRTLAEQMREDERDALERIRFIRYIG